MTDDAAVNAKAAVVTVVALALAATACGRLDAGAGSPSPDVGGSPTPITTPSPSPSPTVNTGLTAVVGQLFGAQGSTPCLSRTPQHQYDNCPMTNALITAIDQLTGNYLPLCRCQNPWQDVTMTVASSGPQPVVQVDLDFGAGVYTRLDVYLTSQGGRWVVSDLRCRGGDASTSIAAQHPPSC